ncbi:uncharacterized protein [Haliotis asinina]|uniref:uncharacterized protein isoform X2 n=1 Tax=Haliotis asinina TaxID=109174 RepID=UPI003531F762
MATGGDDGDTEVDAALDTSPDVQRETKHYDVALLFAENDKHLALEILEHLEQIPLENGEKPQVCLYTDLPGASAHTETGRNLIKVATLIFVLATENLQDGEVAKLIKDEAIGNTRLASKCQPELKYCVRPLYFDRERKAHPPSGLSTIQEVRWYDKDSRCGLRDIKKLLQNHISYRKQREQGFSHQRRIVGNTNSSSELKHSTENINFPVSTEPAHQQRQVPERDISPERAHLDSPTAVRLPAMSHTVQVVMATPAPEVGQQSLDSINLQARGITNGSSVQSRSSIDSSGVRAPGQSASEQNYHQPPDSAVAQRNNDADYFMNPTQRPDVSGESYLSQDGASTILDSSPTVYTLERMRSGDADSERNQELQTSGSREEQDSGTRNTFLGSESETDEGSIVESDLTQINLTTDISNAGDPNTDIQHTTDQIYSRNVSTYSEPAENDVSTSLTGKGTEFTQTKGSLLVGENGKQLKGHLATGAGTGSLVVGAEHRTMTEKVLKHTDQAHRPTARCGAPNDFDFGGGEKEPYDVVEPRIVHYHTHYHSEGEQEQRNRRTPLNVVGCSNVQIGSGQQIIRGLQTVPNSSGDAQSTTPTTIYPEGSPPPYSVDDPNQRRDHLGYGVRHGVLPEPLSDESEETTTKQIFNSDDVSQDEHTCERMKSQNEGSSQHWLPMVTDGGSYRPPSGNHDSGFFDPRLQCPGTSTSDAHHPPDLDSMESRLGSGNDLLQMIPVSSDEDRNDSDASDTGETPRLVLNELPARSDSRGPEPTFNTPIASLNVFHNQDSRRRFVYTEALKHVLKALASPSND